VLSGDQLYVMDFRKILEAHVASGTDITVAATPVTASVVSEFGILQIDSFGTVTDFVEKPREVRTLEQLALSEQTLAARGVATDRRYLASMGIYVFRPEILNQVLEDPTPVDFGKEVIPQAIAQHHVHSHFFPGYWEDIGTIRTFYAANLELASAQPPVDLFSEDAPIFTRPRFLPGTQMQRVRLEESIVCEGSRLKDAEIDHSIIGIRSIVGRGVRLSQTIMMGADFYELEESARAATEFIPVGVGAGSSIECAIIDKNARIGEGVTIRNKEGVQRLDGPGYYIRDGIVIVPKNGVIPAGTVI
jgi:glucose-1-phosphate adenylyltransferase